MTYINTNLVVIIVILAVMILLYAFRPLRPAALSGAYPSANIAYWFFAAMFACFLIQYQLADLFQKDSTTSDTAHIVYHVTLNVVGNISSLCLLGAAVAYSRGKQFDLGKTALVMGVYIGLVLMWSLLMEMANHRDSVFLTALGAAPVMALSGIAGAALGWAFFVRWGWTGFPLLVISVAYSFLQLPAYIRIEFANLNSAIGTGIAASDLSFVFPLLAGGKLLLTYGFLTLLCGSNDPVVAIETPRNWPAQTASVPQSAKVIWGWFVGLAVSFIVALVTDPLKEIVVTPLSHAVSKYFGWS